MTLNGRSVDPRTVRADPPKPIDPSLREEYLRSIVDLRADLGAMRAGSGREGR